ncbi:MAG TPA: amidohydrolase family protein, partial [Chthonomonadaceae bacterium]|nr:amidohydrolase family protein [Chthonomonadaceae bacterium]
ELIRHGTGAIAEMYARRGISWDAPGGSTIAYLDSLGILGPQTLLVHGIELSAGDRARVCASGAAWAHCPKSNAKLGVGVAPLGILGLFRREGEERVPEPGARVGLGSDSVASNNTMDMFEEMRFAVLMQRAAHHRIHTLSAPEALEMATLGGARALGMEADIGSLEPGKRADLCAVHLDSLHSLPAYDPYSALVYSAHAANVVWTMIAGVTCYAAARGPRPEDRFPHIEIAPVRARLQEAAQKMRAWRPTS